MLLNSLRAHAVRLQQKASHEHADRIRQLLCTNLRRRIDDDLRFTFIQNDLPRDSDRSPFVLLRARKLRSARGVDQDRKRLIRGFACHVQENVSFPDMFRRFRSRVIWRGLSDSQSGTYHRQQREH